MFFKFITVVLRLAYRHLSFIQFLQVCKYLMRYGFKGYRTYKNMPFIKYILKQKNWPTGTLMVLGLIAIKLSLTYKSKA